MSKLKDGRNLPIFIHSELDDLNLTSRAFRIYAHLARRSGKSGAFPSYNTMGEKCFRADLPTAKPDTLRRMAIHAVAELVAAGLIYKETRSDKEHGNTSNLYTLTERNDWASDNAPPSDGGTPHLVHMHPPSDNAPKGTPIEGTPIEEKSVVSVTESTKPQTPVQPLPPPLLKGEKPPYPALTDMDKVGTAAQVTQQRSYNYKYCKEYQPQQHRVMFEFVTVILKKQAMVDADHDRTIGDLQQAAVTLTRLGQTVESVQQLIPTWQLDWRGKKGGSANQFIDFVSEQIAPDLPLFSAPSSVVSISMDI